VIGFQLGRLVATRTVADLTKKNTRFATFVSNSLKRYVSCDWGDLCDDDKTANDVALQNGEGRICAAYLIPFVDASKRAVFEEFYDEAVWIITESDHSATTILFPSEY
jgi:hypothetical protein